MPVARGLSESTADVLRQGSSAVEQGTHKPLVGSSILPLATIFDAFLPLYFTSFFPFDVYKTYRFCERS